MIKMHVTGANRLAAELRNVGERVVENARKTMNASALRVVKQAKINAPVDDHELEDSIHIEKTYADRGRLQIEIVAGGIVRGVDVDDYAAIIHEDYASMTPGPKTVEKRLQHPSAYIGEGFLERALQNENDKLTARLIGVVVTESRKL